MVWFVETLEKRKVPIRSTRLELGDEAAETGFDWLS